MANEKALFSSLVQKYLLGAFIIGGAWARLEYKTDQMSAELLKRIDEHIIGDRFEKEAIRKDVTELRQSINNMRQDASEYLRSEFVRPEQPRIERKRR